MASPEKQFEKAVAAYQSGKYASARKILTKLERDVGAHPQILHLKAFIEVEIGTPNSAIHALNQAANQFPNDGNVFNALGVSLRKSGLFDASEQAHRRAIDLNAQDPAFHQNYGNLLSETDNLSAAVAAYKEALRLDPSLSEVAISLSNDLARIDMKEEAVSVLSAQISQDPENIDLLLQLANLEHQSANLPVAHKLYKSVADIEPDNAKAANGLMSISVLQGDVESAITNYQKWVSKHGKSQNLDGSYVYSLNYLASVGPMDLKTAAEAVRSTLKVPGSPPAIRRNNRPLKIGILSRKFGMHPVNFFLSPLIAASDSSEFEFELFASHVPDNQASRSIRGLSAHWHDITHMSPEDRVKFIRARNLDVAITPSGHEESEILDLFRPRIAPTQVAAFAIFGTTGVKQMDGLLTDHHQTPAGSDEEYTEDLIRMPNGYVCFQPYEFLPPLTYDLPRDQPRATFGSFNNLAKVCNETLSLWAAVLNAVPGSTLLVKTYALGNEQTRQKFNARAETHGVDPGRLILEGPDSHDNLLRSYLRIDVALDPLAYSGGLTTLEALWMGVPVVSLPGSTFARRHSLSHLSVAGLADWAANSSEQYIEIASRLAHETESRDDFRSWLRSKMQLSPTSDPHAYAKDFSKSIQAFINN